MPNSDDRPPPAASGPAPATAGPPQDARPLSEREERRERNDRWIDRLRLRLGLKPANNIRENLEEVLEESAKAGAGFSEEERALLRNILELREQRVEDIAVPRSDIQAVQKDIAIGELLKVFEDAGHTRLIVYDDTLDDPVGLVHIKDLISHMVVEARKSQGRKTRARTETPPDFALGAAAMATALSSTKLIRPVMFIPPSMPLMDLLQKMQATRFQMALVIDEYGGTDGLVTVKDVVSTIVGEIDDEHDVDEGPSIKPSGDNAYVADARVMLDEVRETLGPTFDPGEDISEEVDTLGGYLTALASHVPIRGEVLQGPGGIEFEVIDADPRRVKRVKIRRPVAIEPPRAEPPAPAVPPGALPAPATQPSGSRDRTNAA